MASPATIEQETCPSTDALLRAWLTLEVLSPQSMPTAQDVRSQRRQLVRLSDHPTPWSDPQFAKQDSEKALFWMVYLGGLDLPAAFRGILELFPDEHADERLDQREGTGPIAVVVLDERGCPVGGKVFLSSFTWGYGKVLSRSLSDL